MHSVLPRYKAIKQHLLEAVREGRYGPGQQIPTEMALAEQFTVSRMTANKAIQELVSDGVLVRHQGLGTFVAEVQAESPLLEIRNIADEIRARHHIYSSERHRLEAVSVDSSVAARMGLNPGEIAFHSLIVHRENGVPIQLEDRYVNAEVVPDYLQQDFSALTPSQYLSERFPLSEVEHIVEAVAPSAEVQQLLGVKAEEPCLQVNRRTWSDQGLISCARLIHPGNRYRLSSRSRR
ncbi:histidine utilization repressor [Motiliproteus sp. SC1-56]|uniref:histidine utilization repressor n=1 Tax=Motiliproteus sp. SC1-56 TaxID=2799565 RepID=UPI001A8F769A|nr:histidine utilization repressor [Motiliproteus sp. SC1-56]